MLILLKNGVIYMKIFNKFLSFLNRQIVRLNWGVNKFYVFIILINAVSNLITALTITGTFTITIRDILIMYMGGIVFTIIVIYIFSKMQLLQKETKQWFDERTSNLWLLQTKYLSLLIAKDSKKEIKELEKETEELNKKLFGGKENEI